MSALFELRVFPAWLVLLLAAALLLTIPGIADLPALPRSDHARLRGNEEVWNPDRIADTMARGGCGQVTAYACPDDTIIFTCSNPNNALQQLGLVIGKTIQQVITGYTARAGYWQKKVDGCDYLGPFSPSY